MTQAKQGDTVKVHYTGKLDDGTVFDSSMERDPLEFKIGDEEVIPGFEQAVIGMSPGETKSTEIPAEEAYGPYNEDMVLVVEHEQFPQNLQPEVNQQFQIHQEDGQTFIVTVTDISDEGVTLDANHPLAGEDLTFDIQLVEIV